MSNPFQDSSYDINPFDDGEDAPAGRGGDVNPFADSSVAEARGMSNGGVLGMSEYHPFERTTSYGHSPANDADPPRYDVADDDVRPDLPPPPINEESGSYRPPSGANGGFSPEGGGQTLPPLPAYDDNFSSLTKEEQLARKEDDLKKKEKELRNMEDHIDYRKKNWPFCYPILYHNIHKDVGMVSASWLCRAAFLKWHVLTIVFVLNFLVLVVQWCMDIWESEWSAKKTITQSVVLSFVYVLLSYPIAFVLWYYPLYTAARKERASPWVFFYCLIFLHLCVLIFLMLGIPGLGSCGVWNMFYAFFRHNVKDDHKDFTSQKTAHIVLGVLFLFILGLWSIMFGWALLLIGGSVYCFLRRSTKGRGFKEDFLTSDIALNVKVKGKRMGTKAAAYTGRKAAEAAAEETKRQIDGRVGAYLGEEEGSPEEQGDV